MESLRWCKVEELLFKDLMALQYVLWRKWDVLDVMAGQETEMSG